MWWQDEPRLNLQAWARTPEPQDYPGGPSQLASERRAGSGMPVAQVPCPNGGEPAGPGSRTPGWVGAAASTFRMKSPPILAQQ